MSKNVYEKEILKFLGKINPNQKILSSDFTIKLFDEDSELLEKFSNSIVEVNFNDFSEDFENKKRKIFLTIKPTVFSYLMLKKLREEDFHLSELRIEKYAESRNKNMSLKINKIILDSYKFKIESIDEISISSVDLCKNEDFDVEDGYFSLVLNGKIEEEK